MSNDTPETTQAVETEQPKPKKLYEVPELSPEELARAKAWAQDKAIRALRDHGYCEEGTRILRAVLRTPVHSGANVYSQWFDSDGVDCRSIKWRDENGYDLEGLDEDGYDHEGFDRENYDRDGFDREGLDRSGIHRDSPDRFHYNRLGFTWGSVNKEGRDRQGVPESLKDVFYIFDAQGTDKDGYTFNGQRRDADRGDRGYTIHHDYRYEPTTAYGRVATELGLYDEFMNERNNIRY